MKATTLRDKFAMSMPYDAIPVIKDTDTLRLVSKAYGIEPEDYEDTLQMIEWSIKYQTIIRYMYADEMMKQTLF